MTVAVLVLLLSVVAAEPLPDCPLGPAPRPVLDIRARAGRTPLTVYPLGFSATGRFAWLERRRGFDDDAFQWSLHITDLARNQPLKTRSFMLTRPEPQALCRAHGVAIKRLLDQYGVQRGSPVLEDAAAAQEPMKLELRQGKSRPDTGRIPYVLALHVREGVQRLGPLWQVAPDSGEPPVGAPKMLGFLRSPSEPRIAVIVTQEMLGTEGVAVTLVHVLGGLLTPDMNRSIH